MMSPISLQSKRIATTAFAPRSRAESLEPLYGVVRLSVSSFV